MQKFENRAALGALIITIVLTTGLLFVIINQLNMVSGQSQASEVNTNDTTVAQLLQLLIASQNNQANTGVGSVQNVAPLAANQAQATAIPTPTQLPTPIPTVTSLPVHEEPIDYAFTYMSTRAECTVATQIVVKLMQQWGYHIEMEEVSAPEELFHHLSHGAEEDGILHLTLCYTDPEDRAFFRTFVSEIAIIGNGYYDNGTSKLYTVAAAELPAHLNRHDFCVFSFLREFNEHPILLEGQDVADFLFEHQGEVELWGDCFGHKGESSEEHKSHQDELDDAHDHD